MMKKVVLLTVACAALTACDKSQYESEPVTLQTPQGDVTCQLYRHDIVMWDEAISRPAAMTDDAANALCEAEGQREKAGGE